MSLRRGALCLFEAIAQSVEQRTFNPWVVGSIPTGPRRYLAAPTKTLGKLVATN